MGVDLQRQWVQRRCTDDLSQCHSTMARRIFVRIIIRGYETRPWRDRNERQKAMDCKKMYCRKSHHNVTKLITHYKYDVFWFVELSIRVKMFVDCPTKRNVSNISNQCVILWYVFK